MAHRKRSYVDIKGIIHLYEYDYYFSEMNHRPRHKCGKKMKFVKKIRPHSNSFDNIGYICELCNIVYISNKYKILKIKENNQK